MLSILFQEEIKELSNDLLNINEAADELMLLDAEDSESIPFRIGQTFVHFDSVSLPFMFCLSFASFSLFVS